MVCGLKQGHPIVFLFWLGLTLVPWFVSNLFGVDPDLCVVDGNPAGNRDLSFTGVLVKTTFRF
jgi:hypothetical protein